MRSRTKRLFTYAPHGWPDNSAPDGIEKPPELTWHDYLVLLLEVAAEIEHALMVQYLYAAYSLDDTDSTSPHQSMVWWWKKSILAIAKEEMGHLLTVQNVLRLVGGPISLDRSDYPWDTPFYPFDFSLEPLTFDTLCCYLFAEMPDPIPDKPERYILFKTKYFEEVKKTADKHATGGSAKGVHVIYDWILKVIENEEWIPDHYFDSTEYSAQASTDEWSKGHVSSADDPQTDHPDADHQASRKSARVIVEQLASRTDALDALHRIATQGEGAASDDSAFPSHFDRFLEIFYDFKALGGVEHAAEPTWTPARNVVSNPVTVRGNKDERVCYIESNVARNWGRLFNLRYRMLLTYLAHMYRLPPPANPHEPSARSGALHRVFSEMYNVKTLSDILMQTPVTDAADEQKMAGPPFEMPYTLALPVGEMDRWRLHRELLTASRNLCCYLYGRVRPDQRGFLGALRELDARSLDWIDQLLDGSQS